MRRQTIVFAFLLCVFSVGFEVNAQDEPPRLSYTTSWIGNSFGSVDDRWVQNFIDTLYVHPDGTLYGGGNWDEGGGEVTVYENNDVVGQFDDLHGWGRGAVTAVTRYDEYVYVAIEQGSCEGDEEEINDNSLPAYPECPDEETSSYNVWYAIRRYTPEGFAAPFPSGYGWDGSMLLVSQSGNIYGMAAHEDELYVSDTTSNRILVYNLLDFGSSPVREWAVTTPHELAFDSDGTLYVLSQGEIPAVLRFTRQGNPLLPSLIFADTITPTAIALDQAGNLVVTDDGIDQNIKRYALQDESMTLVGTLGETGGVAGAGGLLAPLRFNGLTGVGVDESGTVYVTESGHNTSLSAYTSDGERLWIVYSNEFVDSAVFDPLSDGLAVYTDETRYTMDYSATGGIVGSAEAFTLDRFSYPNDPRNYTMETALALFWIDGQKFLYTTDMYSGGPTIYRFEGEIAVPSGMFSIYGGDENETVISEAGVWLWRDVNGDGIRTQDEHLRLNGGDGWGVDVDDNAGLWFTTEEGTGVSYFPLSGLDEHGNPIYDPTAMSQFDAPESGYWQRVIYEAASDTLYIGGYLDDETDECWGVIGKRIIRYDGWLAGDRTPTWTLELPYACDTGEDILPKAMTIAGDYLFTVEGYTAQVSVYDLETSTLVGTLSPGDAVGNQSGWIDIPYALHAVRRSNGTYVLLVEEDLYGKIIVYEWTP